jgi:hypothetical protein
MPSRSGFPFAKTVTVLAIAFGIALGMCGLNAVLMSTPIGRGGPGDEFGRPALVVLGLIELAVMAISGPLLVLTVIVWIIADATSNRRQPGTQTLFGDDDEK